MERVTLLSVSLFAFISFNFAQGVGVNYDGSAPTTFLDVKTNNAADGININNMAADGDPLLSFELNSARIITMGVDDSDADKFLIGTSSINTNTRLSLLTNGRFGINTTAPGNLWHMTNGATVIGANSMANFQNTSVSGVALASENTSVTSGYNSFEGIIRYSGGGAPAGVFGLHIYSSVAVNSPGIGVEGFTNEWQGTGVRGGRFNSGGANTGFGGLFINDLGYTGGFFFVSDDRLKKNVASLENASDLIRQLRPVSYDYKVDEHPLMGLNAGKEFGFIAQEVQQVLPNVVRQKSLPIDGARHRTANGGVSELPREEVLMMDYTRLIPLLVQALQEQQARIDALEAKFEATRPVQNEVQE